MRRFLLAPLALLLALAVLPAFTPASGDVPADDPEVLALVFAADWCGACKVLDPKLKAVMPGLADQPVEFVVLDQTDRAARETSAKTAASGGYTAVYREYEGKTGFVLLVDAKTKTVLDRITASDSEAQIRGKVRAALSRS